MSNVDLKEFQAVHKLIHNMFRYEQNVATVKLQIIFFVLFNFITTIVLWQFSWQLKLSIRKQKYNDDGGFELSQF